MKKNKLSVLLGVFLFSSCLIGCSTGDATSNSSDTEGGICGISELIYMSEEEQYEKSDVVYIIEAGKQGNVEKINNCLIYTIYYFEVLEILKGTETISYAFFRGDTRPHPSMVSSLDEKLTEGEQYKLYLRLSNDKYFTTAGFQSIIKIE